LIKVSSNVHLNENKDHQFAIHRKYSGTEYVKFYIYKLEIVYQNFTIYYDFISNSTVGAANYGNDHSFFNLYKENLDKFLIDVNAEMRIIINSLSKSNNLLVLGQASTIDYCISENCRRYFP
jgi:hypothetical protein